MKKTSSSCCKKNLLILLMMFLIATPPVLFGATPEQVISVSFKNATLIKALEALKSAGCKLEFNKEDVEASNSRVTLDVKNMPVNEVIALCLHNTNFTYRAENNVYKIFLKDNTIRVVSRRIISGRIRDAQNNPIIGASVVVKGNNQIGTSSDIDGEFKLKVDSNESVTLIVSYIGMKTIEVPVKGTDPITIKMMEDNQSLEGVVVTGYSNISKKSFTGNSISVDKKELLQATNRNVISALQTFDPSFRISEQNLWGSDPNMVPEFTIRGSSSLGVSSLDRNASISKSELKNNSNLPIFIMDGFEVSAEKVYDYDVNRIESITILKDAAATAMYGSRAANGVVVITTQAPKPGRVRVNYTMTGEITSPDLSDYNLMNASEKLDAEVKAQLFGDGDVNLNDEYLAKRNNILRGVDTYWLSQPLRTVFNHKHSIYIDGGTEDLRFGVDLKYDTQGGVMKKSARDRMGAGFAIDYRIKGLQIKNYVSYNSVKSNESPYGLFSDYANKLPYDEMYDEFGNALKNTTLWSGVSLDKTINPLYEATLNSFDRSSYTELIDNLGINYNIIDGLQFKGTFSVTKIDRKSRAFTDPKSRQFDNESGYAIETVRGRLVEGSGQDISWDANAFLAYNKGILKHNINFSLGINAQSVSTESQEATFRGFPSAIMSEPAYASMIDGKPTYSDDLSRLFGSFAILNYSYNNIYLTDLTFRLDGSSKFGSNKRMAPFWSLGLGLNIHNYDFMKKIELIDRLKIRGTYGEVGKVNFPPYAAISTYNTYNDWYSTGYGVLMEYFGNPNLTWEKTRTLDVGFDLSILKGLIDLNFSYYRKKTVDLITDITIPSSSGFTSYKANLGEIMNKGFEIMFRSAIINRKDLNVTLYANLAHNKNEILKVSDDVMAYNDLVNEYYSQDESEADLSVPNTKYEVGASTTSIYAMRSLGIDPSNGKEMFLKRDGTITYDWNAAEQVIVGNTEPKAQGSFGLNVMYKGFSLFTSFLYEWGAQRYNSTLVNKVENADIESYNVDKRVLSDRWQKPGDITPLKNIADRDVTTKPTSRFVQDYNMLELSSLSIGYDFKTESLKKLGISMLRIQANTSSLFVASSVLQERGTSYPFARTYGFTINLNF